MAKKTKRHLNKKSKPKLIKLTPEQTNALLSSIAKSDLSAETEELIELMIHGHAWFARQLEQGTLTIAKLRKLFQIQGSEKAINRNPLHHKAISSHASGDKIKAKGHGRNGAKAYAGAQIVNILHPDLTPGAICPAEACGGRLYEMSDPGVVIRVTGAPLAQATRYHQQKLRCAICEAIYTAPLPKNVSDKKYNK